MMARWLCTVMMSALLFSSGCCCFRGPCDPCGNPTCCLSLPLLRCLHPIAWDGCCNDCGPSPCESCGAYCGGGCCQDGLLAHCPLFRGCFRGCLRGCLSCGRGCGEIYCDEWKSDPPDCCDPCDQCYGQFTGPHGYCNLGPFQRILACLDGYRYCPPPNCGPWRPIFGHCSPWAGSWGGPPGCSTCAGGPPHGADIYYEGAAMMPGVTTQGTPIRTQRAVPAPGAAPGGGTPAPRTLPEPRREAAGIFDDESSDTYRPQPKVQPARPLPTAQPAPPYQTNTSAPQRMTAQQIAAAKRAARQRAYEAAGIRSTNYQP